MHISKILKGFPSEVTESPVITAVTDDSQSKVIDRLLDEQNDHQEQISDLNSELAVMKHDLDTKEDEIAKLKEEINRLQNTHKSELGLKDNIIGTLQHQIQDCDKENGILKNKLEMQEQSIADLRNKVDNQQDISNMLHEIRENMSSQTADVTTQLSDDEVADIMTYLVNLQNTYFQDIPLASDQIKAFVFNVPSHVYDGMRDAIDREDPDVMNPIMMMYVAFIDDSGISMGKYLEIIRKLLDDEKTKTYIEESAKKYDTYYCYGDEDELVDSETVEEDDYNG